MYLNVMHASTRPVQRALPSRANGRARPGQCARNRAVLAFVTTENISQEKPGTVNVRFTLQRKVAFGQELMVCGDCPELGGWELGGAAKMSWSEGDVWHADVALPAGAGVQWKFVQTGGEPQWEPCLNRILSVDSAATELTCQWSAPLSTTARPALAAAAAIDDDCGSVTDEDAPAPAFKPAAALAQLADAVKQSLQGGNASRAADTPVAAAAAAPAVDAKQAGGDGAAPSETPAPAAQQQQEAEQQPAESDDKPQPPVPAAVKVPKPVQISAEATAAVESIIDAAGPGSTGVTAPAVPAMPGDEADEKAAAPTASAAPAAPAAGSPTLQTIGKVAGTVAMGVGAAAMLSAFAVDIADVAMLGAVAAGSVAALSTPSGGAAKSGGKARKTRKRAQRGAQASRAAATGAVTDADTAEAEAEAEPAEAAEAAERDTEMIGQKASAPGVILAASVLSAIDAGKKILGSSDDGDRPDASSKSRRGGAKNRP